MTVAELKKKLGWEVIGVDTVGKNKLGNIVFRKSFFYRHNYNSNLFKERISKMLASINVPFEIIDAGEHWASFRGGASVAQQSHWYCEVKI